MPLDFAHPVWFALALPAAILALGLLGLVLASTFVLFRNANALSNLLEYPIWLVTGLLVALSLLPGWTRPISWVLAPTWGIRAIRDAALGGAPADSASRCASRSARSTSSSALHARLLRGARPQERDALADDERRSGSSSSAGYLAYRALFNWIHWIIYVPTMLGRPLFQILFFAYIGRFAGLESDEFFVVGNAVRSPRMAGIYGMAMTIGGERWTQTLSPLLATPANRLALFLGRALPNLGERPHRLDVRLRRRLGSCSTSTLPPPRSPAIARARRRDLVLVHGARDGDRLDRPARRATSSSSRTSSIFLFLLFCGVNIPIDTLPGWMQAVSKVLPLTHGIDAAREVADGASLGDVSGLVLTELGIGLFYAALAYGLLRLFEVEGRRRASLETI